MKKLLFLTSILILTAVVGRSQNSDSVKDLYQKFDAIQKNQQAINCFLTTQGKVNKQTALDIKGVKNDFSTAKQDLTNTLESRITDFTTKKTNELSEVVVKVNDNLTYMHNYNDSAVKNFNKQVSGFKEEVKNEIVGKMSKTEAYIAFWGTWIITGIVLIISIGIIVRKLKSEPTSKL